MKSVFSLLAVMVLLSACNLAHDYPNKNKYYDTVGYAQMDPDFPVPNSAPRKKKPVGRYLENIDEVCVGQWCSCSSD